MSAKIINLADFKNNKVVKNVAKNNSEDKYVNKYKEALKKMSKEELLKFEELLEN